MAFAPEDWRARCSRLEAELGEARRELAEERCVAQLAGAVLDAAGDGILILGRDLVLIQANRRMEEFLPGCGDMLGCKCHSLLKDRDQPCDGCPALAAMEGGRPTSGEIRIGGEGDEPRWLETVSHPMHGVYGEIWGTVNYFKDITSFKLSEAERWANSRELAAAYSELEKLQAIIIRSRNKLKVVFDALPDPILAFTPEGRVDSLNLAAAAPVGRHPRELAGLPLNEYMDLVQIYPEVRREAQEALAAMNEHGRSQERLIEARDEDGTHYFRLILLPVRDEDGGLMVTMAHFQDVTRQKRMEETIRQYSHTLEERVALRTRELKEERDRLSRAYQDLRRLDQLRQDLTSMVVHDMKGPLAELMGNLDLLRHIGLDPEQGEVLEMAIMGGEDLNNMILNLLDIGRLEEGKLKVRRETIDFGELTGDLLGKFRTLIRLQGIEALTEDATARPLKGDYGLVLRILQNLLMNALNHTPGGGRITLGAGEDGGGAVLWVKDTGRGIPPEARERIFQKFTQAVDDGPRTSTGLGLTFCKLAVEAHGGRIWLESREGSGSTFFFSLPRRAGENGEDDPSGSGSWV